MLIRLPEEFKKDRRFRTLRCKCATRKLYLSPKAGVVLDPDSFGVEIKYDSDWTLTLRLEPVQSKVTSI